MSDLSEDVFAISPNIRYVALAHGQQVQMRSRPDLRNASSSDSDLYEELLVNPTLLTLATRRGNIDCGGLRYLIIGYGHFHQLVVPRAGGHVSVAFELGADPADYLQAILGVLARHGRLGQAEVPDKDSEGRKCAGRQRLIEQANQPLFELSSFASARDGREPAGLQFGLQCTLNRTRSAAPRLLT